MKVEGGSFLNCFILRLREEVEVSFRPATPSSTSGCLKSWTLESDQAGPGPTLSLPAVWPWTSCPRSLNLSS